MLFAKLKDIITRNNAQPFAKIRLWKVKIPDDREDQLNNLSFARQRRASRNKKDFEILS